MRGKEFGRRTLAQRLRADKAARLTPSRLRDSLHEALQTIARMQVMPLGRPGERDRYGRRWLVAAALALLCVLLVPLLGPSPERMRELLAHTGVEGPLELLPAIDILPDEQEQPLDPMQAMPQATEGIEIPPQLSSPVESAENQVNPSERMGKPAAEHWTTQLRDDPTPMDPRSQLESHSPSQRSLDFVLDRFVKPEYPEAASAEARSRVVLVKVAMYVDEQGLVAFSYIIESDGGPLFDRAVLDAVRLWRYRPVVFDREPEGFWDQQLVRFVISARGPQVELLGG
jgi:TonB family protein